MKNVKIQDFTANDVGESLALRVKQSSAEDGKPYICAVDLDLFDKILDFEDGTAEPDTNMIRIHFNDPDVLRNVINQLELGLEKWENE